VAVHTFVPVFDGEERSTDVGILFDPARRAEVSFAKRCQSHVHAATGLLVHRNAPYRGTADGLPTLLRREYSVRKYVGIELEVSQRIAQSRGRNPVLKALRKALVLVLAEHFDDLQP
jgi:predicted N-formylglutamate amidohydrolase